MTATDVQLFIKRDAGKEAVYLAHCPHVSWLQYAPPEFADNPMVVDWLIASLLGAYEAERRCNCSTAALRTRYLPEST